MSERTRKRREEVLNACLECFVANRSPHTPLSELGDKLNMPKSGIYYYFESKDAMVKSCAQRAAQCLEESLMEVALDNLKQPELMIEELKAHANKLAPTMKFFASVSVDAKYQDMVKPSLQRLSKRYDTYAEKVAEQLGCNVELVRPYVYMAIVALNNYMIFGEESLLDIQLAAVKERFESLLEQLQN